MVVVAVVLLVVAVALAVLLVKARARVDELTEELAATGRARDEADAARRRAEADAATARAERTDALEREKRAKRSAADVAKHLAAEREARVAADAARAAAEDDAAAARVEGDVAELWELALAATRRTWEVSVAPSPGMPSPLDHADDPLRAAIEIEVDAAREEAGAAIELEWRGDAVVPPAIALRALTIAQELVARLAKVSDTAVLRVDSGTDRVAIEVEGTDAAGRSVVPTDVAAEHQVAPGRYVLGA